MHIFLAKLENWKKWEKIYMFAKWEAIAYYSR